MFKWVAVGFLFSASAQAAEETPLCKPSPSTMEQVTVLGDYAGKSFAFTLTIDGKPQPGFDNPPQEPKPATSASADCPLTS